LVPSFLSFSFSPSRCIYCYRPHFWFWPLYLVPWVWAQSGPLFFSFYSSVYIYCYHPHFLLLAPVLSTPSLRSIWSPLFFSFSFFFFFPCIHILLLSPLLIFGP
jgi:hypothetical protein